MTTGMTTGPHVFGDGRVGLWIINPANLTDRLPKIKAKAPYITDIFLPLQTAQPTDKATVQNAGLYAQGYAVGASVMTAEGYADSALANIARLATGALDANIELPNDAALGPYIHTFMARFRKARPNYRVRLNVAWRKGVFVPADLVIGDPNLYVAEQNYVDLPSMNPCSEADALNNLLDAGLPLAKCAVCYGAAGPVGGITGAQRVNTLPTAFAPRRGVIFQDDLMVESGILA